VTRQPQRLSRGTPRAAVVRIATQVELGLGIALLVGSDDESVGADRNVHREIALSGVRCAQIQFRPMDGGRSSAHKTSFEETPNHT
jgi:hypothetical protein